MTGRKGEAAVDWWTLVHFAAGLVLGLLPIGWVWATAIILGYEGLEAGLRRVKTKDGGLFEYESWQNIGLDIAIGLAGFAITHLAVGAFLPWPFRMTQPF